MLTGPEAMPVFADGALPPQAKRDIIAYITQTRVEPNPGGFSLGRTGPVTEGLVIFLGGLGFLVLISMWITAKRRDPTTDGADGDGAEVVMSDMEETEGTEGTESPGAPHRVIGTPPPSPRLLGSAAVAQEPGAVALVSDEKEFAEHIDGLPPDDPRVIVHGRRAERVVAACFTARVHRGLRLRRRLRRARGAHGRQDPAVQPGAGALAVRHAPGPRPGRADLGPAPDAERRGDPATARSALR